MQNHPTSYRVGDPGIRALFAEPARIQSWLDVEVALAQAQAELGVIPAHAAEEIAAKARCENLDMDNIREGLARTGHPLVPMIWELDRICEGDAGGYIHWGATTQNITQTGMLLNLRRAHRIFLALLADLLTELARIAESTKGLRAPRPHARPARRPRHLRLQSLRLDRRTLPPRRPAARLRRPRIRRNARRRRRHPRIARRNRPRHPRPHGATARNAPNAKPQPRHRRPPRRIHNAS